MKTGRRSFLLRRPVFVCFAMSGSCKAEISRFLVMSDNEQNVILYFYEHI